MYICWQYNLYFSSIIGSLKMTYLLVDGKVGMTSLDEEFANKLAELQANYCVCHWLCIILN